MLKSLIYIFYLFMLLILIYFILHPNLSVIQSMILLMLFTISTSISLSIQYTFSLYSFLIFLMIIGGLMILFMMFLSLISNQYMNSKWKTFILPSIFISSLMFLFYKLSTLNINMINLSIKFNKFNQSFMNINQLMEFPFNNYIIILMFFLLFNLILITKICIINSKPLRMIKK
uniref:NADH dehydrogenase subunit 6 n=1 Tax=Vespa crabro TaxID=7445 RepID=A0A7L7S1G3_VESCR|nr:NADH dehydrogenase subunit 6 [Vespa crabro]